MNAKDDTNLKIVFEEEDIVAKDVNPKALVKHSNILVDSSWRMNLNQSRIFLTAVSMIDKDDDKFQAYRIKAGQLRSMLELAGKDIYERIKKDVPELLKKSVHIIEKDNKGNKVSKWINLMTSAHYRHGEGDLIIKFSDEMKPYLLNLKREFTQYKLIEALQFKSMYALRLFLFFKQFQSTGWKYISIDELRHALDLNKTKANGLKSDLYVKYNDLKKRVIVPAIKELKKASINIKYKEKKSGRRVVGFKFYWDELADLPDEIIFSPKSEQGERLLNRLTRLRLTDKQIRFLGDALTAKELNETCYGIEQNINSKSIPDHKVGGYAYQTFKNKFNLENF